MSDFSFSKKERLTKKKEIETLFAKGKSFNLQPLRIIFKPALDSDVSSHQILISVPSRNFKRAVDRNLIKRRLREAYRLNKSKLSSPIKLSVAYIYIAKEILPYSIIEEKLVQSFNRLRSEIQK